MFRSGFTAQNWAFQTTLRSSFSATNCPIFLFRCFQTIYRKNRTAAPRQRGSHPPRKTRCGDSIRSCGGETKPARRFGRSVFSARRSVFLSKNRSILFKKLIPSRAVSLSCRVPKPGIAIRCRPIRERDRCSGRDNRTNGRIKTADSAEKIPHITIIQQDAGHKKEHGDRE